MKFFYLFSLIFFLISCSKPKTVFICGDHVCVNKSEAEQYFEKNLTLEVKIIDKKIKEEINLVELNLNNNQIGKKRITVNSKQTLNKKLKTLSNKEIFEIKKNIKNNNKNKKVAKRVIDKKKKIGDSKKTKKIMSKNVNKKNNDVVDVCTILEKCSIDEISKYLLEEGKDKKFPDITKRQ